MDSSYCVAEDVFCGRVEKLCPIFCKKWLWGIGFCWCCAERLSQLADCV